MPRKSPKWQCTIHTYPPTIATSPDGRWLAVGRNTDVISGGGGDGVPPYYVPDGYGQADSVLIFDLQNLTDEAIILKNNDLRVHQMAFTDNNLLILTEDSDGDQKLVSWRIEGDKFIDQSFPILDIDTAFALTADYSFIAYFYEGAVYRYDWGRQKIQLGENNFAEPLLFENPLSLAFGNAYRDEAVIAVMDKDESVRISDLDNVPGNAQIVREALVNGIGRPVIIEGVGILYADETALHGDFEVATPILLTAEADTKLVDFAINPNQDVLAAIVTDGTNTQLTLWDISRGWYPDMPPTSQPLLTIPRENLTAVRFSTDGTKLITVAGFQVSLWSLPKNLLTQNRALNLSQQNILAYCDNTEETPQAYKQGTRLGVVWSWYAMNEAQLIDHLHNARYGVEIDGYNLYHWTFVTQFQPDPEHGNNPAVYFYTPIGAESLAPGVYYGEEFKRGIHRITYDLSWINPITDGFDSFGPGTELETNTGICFVEILE